MRLTCVVACVLRVPHCMRRTNHVQVFIGVQMDKAAIIAMLDACLLSDSEMASYRQHWTL